MTRWEHNCPNCSVRVITRRIFCRDCRKADPVKSSIVLPLYATTLRGKRLPGILLKPPLMMVRFSDVLMNGHLGDRFMCVCCGKSWHRDLVAVAHKCYWRTLTTRNGHFNCYACHKTKATTSFPLLPVNTKVKVRSVVCAKCLDGKEIRRAA